MPDDQNHSQIKETISKGAKNGPTLPSTEILENLSASRSARRQTRRLRTRPTMLIGSMSAVCPVAAALVRQTVEEVHCTSSPDAARRPNCDQQRGARLGGFRLHPERILLNSHSVPRQFFADLARDSPEIYHETKPVKKLAKGKERPRR